MPRNSSGQYSLPAGNPVTTGTVISSNWANTTNSDLGTELTNSLDRNGRGPMLAALALIDGSLSAPGLAFNTDPATGLFLAGPNDLRVQVGGTTVAKFAPAGQVLPAGITVTQNAPNTAAITATGNGTAPGVTAIGGSSGGAGLLGTGTGTGVGVIAQAGGGTAFAINSHGHIAFSGAAISDAPRATVADGSVTYANVPRVGGSFRITKATGAQTINCSYNVAGVSLAVDKTTLTVSFSGVTFSSASSYWLTLSMGSAAGDTNQYKADWYSKTATSFALHISNTNTGITLDLTTSPTFFIIDFEAKGF